MGIYVAIVEMGEEMTSLPLALSTCPDDTKKM